MTDLIYNHCVNKQQNKVRYDVFARMLAQVFSDERNLTIPHFLTNVHTIH